MAEIKNGKTEGSPQEPNLWMKCRQCEQIIYKKELAENFMVCTRCGFSMNLSVKERLKYLAEPGSFVEYDRKMMPGDPLKFPGYSDKVKHLRKNVKSREAIVTGEALIGGHRAVVCIMDFLFLGGSMGSVVGEKIARAAEKAVKKKLPLIIVSASGGARMHEGAVSLMQMAKTSAAIGRLKAAGLPYISVMTNPTTGGVSASFAMLGDINIAEPKSLIGFTGQRVIEQTIKQKLPPGFQSAEFCLEHGMLDMIVERKNMKPVLARLLHFFSRKNGRKPAVKK